MGELAGGHWPLRWLLARFIALCISASIRCFSRLGMRPKRTAVMGQEKGWEAQYMHAHTFSFLPSRKGETLKGRGSNRASKTSQATSLRGFPKEGIRQEATWSTKGKEANV